MKILIADNDPASLLFVGDLLEPLGHEIVVTSDGDEAWQWLQREAFRVVVVSDAMKGGLELCRKVRGRDELLYTYMIVLSSKAQDRAAACAAGADDVVARPIERLELLARVAVAGRIVAAQEGLFARARRFEAEANHDSLTGLKNRRFFLEALNVGFSFARRQKLPLSVAVFDVDHFKSFNDRFGHPAGDEALRAFGQLVHENIREHDLVARFGGEEFILLLPATGQAAALVLCERLRTLIASRPWPLRPITASFGASTSGPSTASGSQLVDEADQALYRSKQAGRNRVTHFHSPPDA